MEVKLRLFSINNHIKLKRCVICITFEIRLLSYHQSWDIMMLIFDHKETANSLVVLVLDRFNVE